MSTCHGTILSFNTIRKSVLQHKMALVPTLFEKVNSLNTCPESANKRRLHCPYSASVRPKVTKRISRANDKGKETELLEQHRETQNVKPPENVFPRRLNPQKASRRTLTRGHVAEDTQQNGPDLKADDNGQVSECNCPRRSPVRQQGRCYHEATYTRFVLPE